MKNPKKRIKTEYKILMIVIALCIVVLIGLYVYKKYASIELDTNDYKNCTIEEYERYTITTCKIMDENREVFRLSYPILKEENCSSCVSINQEIAKSFEEEWNKVRLLRVEGEGLLAQIEEKTEYLLKEEKGILSILKRTYEFYPNKHIKEVRSYAISEAGEKLSREELLNLLGYQMDTTNDLIEETIRKIYFIDYRYDYLSEPNQDDTIRTMLLHFEVSNLDAVYLDEENNLMGIKKIPHPRVTNSNKTYYIHIKEKEENEWYPFESENEMG